MNSGGEVADSRGVVRNCANALQAEIRRKEGSESPPSAISWLAIARNGLEQAVRVRFSPLISHVTLFQTAKRPRAVRREFIRRR